jgi:hypothetical protein
MQIARWVLEMGPANGFSFTLGMARCAVRIAGRSVSPLQPKNLPSSTRGMRAAPCLPLGRSAGPSVKIREIRVSYSPTSRPYPHPRSMLNVER